MNPAERYALNVARDRLLKDRADRFERGES